MGYLLNRALCADDTSGISPRDRGLTLGDGVFETIAIRGGAPVRLDAHLDRLFDGLEVLAFAEKPDRSALPNDLARLIQAEGVADGAARLSVTRGPGGRGLTTAGAGPPTVLITAAAVTPRTAPVDLLIARRVRRNEASPVSRIKALSYLDNVLAFQEAEAGGADDALILNTRGAVAETAIANVFAVHGERLLTPPVAAGALPGTARAAVTALFPVEETLHDVNDLLTAEEAFITNSLGVRRVRRIDGHPIGTLLEDMMTARIRAAVYDK